MRGAPIAACAAAGRRLALIRPAILTWQVQRLLDRALSANKLRSAFTAPESTAELVSEVRLPHMAPPSSCTAPLRTRGAFPAWQVRLEYAHALNGMLLRVGLTRPPLKDKVRAELLLPPPPPPAPELGVISLESNNYVACAASFFAISSLIVPQVVRALAAARHECIQVGRALLTCRVIHSHALIARRCRN